MQRYEAYKDSGVEWIGEIPAGWEVERLKYCLSVNSGGIWGDDPLNDGFDKYVLRSTEQTVGGEWAITDPAIRNMSAVSKLETYRILPGDLVVTKSSGSPNHIGKTTIAGTEFLEREYYYSNFMQRVRLQDENNPRFYWYVMNSDLARNQYVFLQNSTSGLGNLSAETIGLISVPHPRVIEQQAIADYLDVKTAQIDSIVSQTERSIELLREYRKSVISEAVTKGLDPDAPMRDSGIEWIGEIPAGWFILPFKRLANVVANLVTPDNYPEYWQVAPEDMEKDTGRILRYKRVADAAVVSDNHLFNAGLILYSKIRPSLNKVAIAPFDGLCSADMYPISTNEDTRWLLYYMLSNAFTEQVVVSTNRVKMPKLNKEELGNMKVVLPDRNTQMKIADYLDAKTAEIDSLIADKKRQVELLKEYRKSLISEAVTGKFKVPGLE